MGINKVLHIRLILVKVNELKQQNESDSYTE